MSTLKHEGKEIQTVRADWQTKARGSNETEYEIYCDCCDDGNGIDSITGKPLKTYDEWLNS